MNQEQAVQAWLGSVGRDAGAALEALGARTRSLSVIMAQGAEAEAMLGTLFQVLGLSGGAVHAVRTEGDWTTDLEALGAAGLQVRWEMRTIELGTVTAVRVNSQGTEAEPPYMGGVRTLWRVYDAQLGSGIVVTEAYRSAAAFGPAGLVLLDRLEQALERRAAAEPSGL